MSQTTGKKPLAVIKVGGDVLLDANESMGLAQNVSETSIRLEYYHSSRWRPSG